MNDIILNCEVENDAILNSISDKFDFEFTGKSTTTIQTPQFPKEFNIGLIIGSSGSGKSTLLQKCFVTSDVFAWDNKKAIISNFDSADDGIDKLCAVGLCSIPSWGKPYSVLSTGEKFRADVAMKLHDNATIDEYTSVVNREVAKSCSYSISKYIRKHGLKNIVFASCHDDIAEWLQPDWIYNTDTHQFYNGRYLQRPVINVEYERCDAWVWEMYKKHHYLSGKINPAADCYLGRINGYPVVFAAVLSFPFKGEHKAKREHRLVVLPDYQGIGIGNKTSETIAQIYLDNGYRYFSKTTNPKCGVHRDNSPLWKATSHNHKKRMDYFKDGVIRANQKYSSELQKIHANRVCYSHEYIGQVVT